MNMINIQFSYLELQSGKHKDEDWLVDQFPPSLHFSVMPQVGQHIALEPGRFKIHSIYWIGDEGIGNNKAICAAELQTIQIYEDVIKRYRETIQSHCSKYGLTYP